MRKASKVLAASLMGVGMTVLPVAVAPQAGAWIECGPGVMVAGNGGQRCADHRPDGSVWWRDTGCAVFGLACWDSQWYPAPPP